MRGALRVNELICWGVILTCIHERIDMAFSLVLELADMIDHKIIKEELQRWIYMNRRRIKIWWEYEWEEKWNENVNVKVAVRVLIFW